MEFLRLSRSFQVAHLVDSLFGVVARALFDRLTQFLPVGLLRNENRSNGKLAYKKGYERKDQPSGTKIMDVITVVGFYYHTNLIFLLSYLLMKQTLTFFIAVLLALQGTSQSRTVVNLKSNWQAQENENFVKYEGQKTKTIHFGLDKKSLGSALLIYDRLPFSVFINGKLCAQGQDSLRLRVDSLWSLYQGNLFFSIHQEQPVYSLQSVLVSSNAQTGDSNNWLRTGNYFSDFAVIASLLLFASLVFLFRVNTKLTVDYLNVIKLFSLQDRDESTVASRIGSSINLFFFALISFFIGLVLIIIFKTAPDRVRLAGNFIFDTTGQAFFAWILLSLIIFVFLVAKLVLIASFSLLFNIRDAVRFQFFNFIRMLFVTVSIIACIAVVYFIFQAQSPNLFFNLLLVGGFFIIIGTLFLFLKLLARTSFPIFHLFSYLCATEIIPLMIIGRVLLF